MARVTVSECPNCGAPVDAASLSNDENPQCPFCHTALPVEAPAPAPAPTGPDLSAFTFGAPSITITQPEPSSGGGAAGKVIGLIVVLAIIGAVVAVVASASKHSNILGNSSSESPDGKAVAVSRLSGKSDFYVLSRGSGSSTPSYLLRVDPVGKKVTWKGSSLSSTDANQALVLAGPKQAFIISGSNVVADDATTGKELWKASLSNGLASPCDSGCAVVVGDNLIALSKDGALQALNVATGAQTWNKRLNSTPRWLEPAGKFVVTDDKVGETGGSVGPLVVEAATGLSHQIAPTCQATPDNTSPETPNEDDGFFVSPDGNAITTLITGSDGCVARFAVADGSMVWRTPPMGDGNPVPFTLTGEDVTQGPNGLIWTSEVNSGPKQAFTASAANGVIHPVFTFGKNDEVKLTGTVGQTLLVQDAPSYDSSKPATVAIDLATGKQKWSVASRVSGSISEQKVLVSTTGATIVSCDGSGSNETCKFEPLNINTGTIGTTVTLPATPGDASYVSAVQSGKVLITTVGWEHIDGFDATTGALLWKWPN